MLYKGNQIIVFSETGNPFKLRIADEVMIIEKKSKRSEGILTSKRKKKNSEKSEGFPSNHILTYYVYMIYCILIYTYIYIYIYIYICVCVS